MTITSLDFSVTPTYELYSSAVNAGINMCFDTDGEYLPYVEEIAVYFPILLYFTDCDPDQWTLDSVFELMVQDNGRALTDAIMNSENSNIIESAMSAIREGIHTKIAQGKAKPIDTVLNMVIDKLGGTEAVSELLDVLVDSVVSSDDAVISDGED